MALVYLDSLWYRDKHELLQTAELSSRNAKLFSCQNFIVNFKKALKKKNTTLRSENFLQVDTHTHRGERETGIQV